MTLNIVFIGLSVTSSWGNGHATTYRALIAALARQGHRVTFLERDVPWYREHRDLADPADWTVELYETLPDLPSRYAALVRDAHLVVVGSYVPDGLAIADWVTATAQGVTAFYDIDTPVTLAGLDRGLPYLSAAMIPRLDLYLSFSGGPIPASIERDYGSPMARELYCSADLDLYRPQHCPPRWSLGYLGTYSDDRQPLLDDLLIAPAKALTEDSFIVAGAQYPASIRWPGNVERIEHLPPRAHAEFYAAQRFTLNVTRSDMRALGYSPSVRLFEAAACGVPVISDTWPGIETLFKPDSEILIASDPRDVIGMLREMSDDQRLTIGDRARRRILAEHTPDHRARQLAAYYAEAAARRRQAPRRPAAEPAEGADSYAIRAAE
ncbi:spore maturation protein CgeB [Rhodopseudomonas thermotolerans]|uniref:Spore maturation protein CgeB n=2 Tax=Rhodopseudomonas TaxID=1073 RepID=A0A336JNX3_9BRAD|nr:MULTISPECIES: glycosyltransferase [Rhodopseudomonas]RED33262.1 spore maturation protein CgeB [Rhodopseudomonas pentothenatexigens]REF94011.1 spore maturation protein CgeB [Rhodopseudomonas thermotolerans]SSW91338.1 spore maturation protein CgeB [Rhodopseudomonas pentothenatexigens]